MVTAEALALWELLRVGLLPRGISLPGRQRFSAHHQPLPQGCDPSLSWLIPMSLSEAVAGKRALVTFSSRPFQREELSQPFRAARLGRIAQLDVCYGLQSAKQPCTAIASHH